MRSMLGHHVLVLEMEARMGGAWSSKTIFGLESDNGPHLLYNHAADLDEVFAFLEELCEITFEPYTPQPKGEWQCGLANSPELSFGGTRSNWREQMALLKRVIIANADAFLARVGATRPRLYRYPRGGTACWVAGCEQVLRRFGATLLTNAEVTSVSSLNGVVAVQVGDGREFQARSAVLSGRIRLGQITVDGDVRPLPYTERTLLQQCLLIQDLTPRAFSYYKFKSHPTFFLVGDITQTIRRSAPTGHKLIALALNKGCQPNGHTPGYALQQLQSRALLGPNATIAKSETWAIKVIEREGPDTAMLSNNIELLCCNNLMRGIRERVPAWRRALGTPAGIPTPFVDARKSAVSTEQ